MAHNHRKLILDPNPISNLCSPFCNVTRNSFGTCPLPCFSICSSICRFLIPSPLPPPIYLIPTPSIDYQPHKLHKPHPVLIITLIILSTTFLLISCFAAIYVKCYKRTRRSQPQSDETHQEFVDEDDVYGPVLDHPIWYIRTVGLQPSIINSITVCKYKKGEGIVEGTECSVCLNEFQEDETVRLLPKCSHAFHIPCIDTWLKSHTNCPLCRAGIVANTTCAPSPEPNVDNSSSSEETQEGISENNGELVGEREDGVCELRIIGSEEEGELQVENERKMDENLREEVGDDEMQQPMRRSVSMDSISASKISLALANVDVLPQGRSDGNSENNQVKVNEPKRIDGNQCLLRFMGSSSLQNGPIPMKRSVSYSGKFLQSIYSRSRNSIVHL